MGQLHQCRRIIFKELEDLPMENVPRTAEPRKHYALLCPRIESGLNGSDGVPENLQRTPCNTS